jgi:hypothetical protein
MYENETMDPEQVTIAVLSGGGVEYNVKDAMVDIDELIASLENAKDNGVTHVVMSSGNYRGAQWASIGTDWSWAEDEE